LFAFILIIILSCTKLSSDMREKWFEIRIKKF